MTGEEDRFSVDIEEAGITVGRWVFGDRTGVTLFLAAVLFFALYWRIGIFSTDSYAVANTMAGVAEGSLAINEVTYGPPSGITPGMHVVDGRLYGRNFGMVFAALPLVWLQQGMSIFVDLRIALAGGWCLALLGFCTLVGERIDRRELATVVGSVVALSLFAGSVAVATPLSARWYPVIALQLLTMAATGLTAVTIYRLLRRMYGNRVGLAAGITVAFASPAGFWATFPKRHAVTAFLGVLTLYCLFRSREATARRSALRFRALAYVWVGLTAWVHSAEALLLLFALGAVDLATARSNRPLELMVVGMALFLSLLPLFITNYLIAGSPLDPPRLWEAYTDTSQRTGNGLSGGASGSGGSESPAVETGSEPTGGTTGGGEEGSTESVGIVGRMVGGLVAAASDRVALLLGYMETSLEPLGNVERLSNTFIRSGYISGLPSYNDRAINLSVLEAMPLFGVFAILPVAAVEWGRSFQTREGRRLLRRMRGDPARAADGFAVLLVALFVLLYMSRLPTHFMLTGRYIHPIYPFGVYLLARVPAVREVVTEHGTRTAVGYGAAVFIGVPLYIGTLWATNAVLGEAVQLYALVSLTIASLVAGWAVLTAAGGEGGRRLSGRAAPILGIAAGLATVYLIVSGFGFFAYTHEYALPLSRVIAEQLLPINPLRSLF